jgi:hypothetical protein
MPQTRQALYSEIK